MGLLAGYTQREIRQGIQHGQPQMTIADLLGNPLPSSLISAQSMDDVKIAWRKWLPMRVKIVDEYNRIPTRTQSALLTVMADDYAEMYDQVFECPPAAWYLTANDDAGGGTYQVIEALRDRIDIVVKAFHFNTRFLGELLARVEAGIQPEAVVPKGIIFTEDEIGAMHKTILAVRLPPAVRWRIEHFASQFEFCEFAAAQMEYKTKDTVKLSGLDFHLVDALDTGKDRSKDLGQQTRNGLSVRTLMTLLTFVKALAWFRGADEVELDDVRQLIPFVLHDKFVPNHEAAWFDQGGNGVLRVDRVSWIRKLFDDSCAEYERLDLDRDDPLRKLEDEYEQGLDGLEAREVEKRLARIEAQINVIAKGRKLFGPQYDAVLKLKYLHQRYGNYLRWLKWKT